ncbi:MAG: protein translocase subunit SecF [Pseudomonadota bacterium]
MLLKLVPDETKVPFVRFRMIAAALSVVLVVGSIAALATLGLNFGVDFRGGITIEVADDQPIDQDAVYDAVGALNLGEVRVQEIRDFADSDEAVVVFIEQQAADDAAAPVEEAPNAAPVEASAFDANDAAQQTAATRVQDALRALLGDGVNFRRVDIVGPTVSGELIQRGATAVAFAIGLMLLYIWFRFEWQFSVGAILALVHDIVITLGVFAVTRLEFSLAIIAALLTIVGYSMNDTVVVYDRVRENLRKYKKMPLEEVMNLSINDTLSRTVMTSVTTLLALVALYVIGGEVLRGFTFAMIWGVLIGTYSSIFVAAPILLTTGVKRDWSKQEVAAPTPDAA